MNEEIKPVQCENGVKSSLLNIQVTILNSKGIIAKNIPSARLIENVWVKSAKNWYQVYWFLTTNVVP